MLERSVEDRALDLAQAGRVEQRSQVTLAHARQVRFILRVAIDLAGGLPEQAEWAVPAGVVPDARCNDAVAAHDARHLGQPRHRIRHEMDDELREGRVERAVCERQPLGGCLVHVDPGESRPNGGDERLGRVDRGDGRGAQPCHELRGERAGPAPDVEGPLAAPDAGQVRELGREEPRIAAHEAIVCLGGHIEAHRREPSTSSGSMATSSHPLRSCVSAGSPVL